MNNANTKNLHLFTEKLRTVSNKSCTFFPPVETPNFYPILHASRPAEAPACSQARSAIN